jgi:hypothetical protein
MVRDPRILFRFDVIEEYEDGPAGVMELADIGIVLPAVEEGLPPWHVGSSPTPSSGVSNVTHVRS